MSGAPRPNVLVTSAGRRVSLLAHWQGAAREHDARVFAGDASNLAPALYLADGACRLPLVSDEGYVPRLLELVEEHDIGVVVPTIDPELTVLAAARELLAARGCTALVSDPDFVAISGDKWLTAMRYAERGVATPRCWLPDALPVDLPERLFVKPRDGSASRDIHRATPADVATTVARVPRAIVQEELSGPEVTIDALVSMAGEPLHYVPRTRIRTLGGESIQGRTISDPALGAWIEELLRSSAALGARGPLTFQAFLTEDGPVLIEVNPRFGGGYPLGYAAGGHYPEWLLAEHAGGAPEPRLGDYQAGLTMTRYHVELFTTELVW